MYHKEKVLYLQNLLGLYDADKLEKDTWNWFLTTNRKFSLKYGKLEEFLH